MISESSPNFYNLLQFPRGVYSAQDSFFPGCKLKKNI